MAANNDQEEINITKEDQQMINEFARYNQRLQDAEELLKLAEEKVQTLEDASEEMMLGEDTDVVPYKFGDVFIELSSDDIQTRLDNDKDELKKEIGEHKSNIASIKDKMTEMKAVLYGKFGSNINLEA